MVLILLFFFHTGGMQSPATEVELTHAYVGMVQPANGLSIAAPSYMTTPSQ